MPLNFLLWDEPQKFVDETKNQMKNFLKSAIRSR